MPEFNRGQILTAIDTLHEEFCRRNIKDHLSLIIVGAASLILKFNLKRTTADIDVIEQIGHPGIYGGLGPLLGRMGFHIISETMVNLHPDYCERLELFANKGMIHVYTLNSHDLAISKIGRAFGKDIDDILDSDLVENMDIKKLEMLYFEAVVYWIGDEEKFRTNWDIFYESFEKKRKPPV